MEMKLFEKKSLFALLFILFLAFLFYDSNWLGKLLYPIRYQEDILVSSANYDVDPFLIAAIIRVETNFNPDKQSRKGAVGLMQIMPDTADWIVQQAGYAPEASTLLHRPDVNIEIGAWYLNSLNQQFSNNMAAVLAAYNAGPGNAKKWLQSGTWDGTFKNIGQIPFGETRHYIQRVFYYYNKYAGLYSDELDSAKQGKKL